MAIAKQAGCQLLLGPYLRSIDNRNGYGSAVAGWKVPNPFPIRDFPPYEAKIAREGSFQAPCSPKSRDRRYCAGFIELDPISRMSFVTQLI